jgi:chloride channel 3/4/5
MSANASPNLGPTERTSLLRNRFQSLGHLEARSLRSSALLSKEEEALGDTAVGEILPYTPYASIDFLHDLVHHCDSV